MMVVEMEIRLRRELIVKKLKTYIVALIIMAMATAMIVTLTKRPIVKKADDITDEIPSKIMSIIL